MTEKLLLYTAFLIGYTAISAICKENTARIPLPRARRVAKRRFSAHTFFGKGVAFSAGLWYNITVRTEYLPVAQLDSASDSDSEGRRFESFRVGQNKGHRNRGALYFGLFVRRKSFVEAPRNKKRKIYWVALPAHASRGRGSESFRRSNQLRYCSRQPCFYGFMRVRRTSPKPGYRLPGRRHPR